VYKLQFFTFIIYINDIVSISKILQTILFADDASIFLIGPNINKDNNT